MRTGAAEYLLAALALAAGACGAGESAGTGTVVRDSAGIAIVENVAPAWSEDESWTVSPAPVVEIGVVEGAPEYQLFRVRSAIRLSAGRIVVVNGGTQELRYYDSTGRHLVSVGGEGGGPGEFEGLRRVARLPGDTLIAWDGNGKRLSLFAAEGEFLRSIRAAEIDGIFPRFHGAFGDGTFVLTQGVEFDFEEGTDISRLLVGYLRFGLDGLPRDTLGPFPGPQEITMTFSSGDNRLVTRRSLPFARETYVAVHHDRFYAANSDRYEVAVYTSTGVLTALIRKSHEPLEVTPDDVDRFEENFVGGPEGVEPDAEGRRRRERIFAEMPFPETFPAFADLRVDAAGNVWVEEYRRPGDERPPIWTIFDSTGRLLGTVETPPDLDIYQIGLDFVLGRWQDEFEVDHVHLYGLTKPGRS